MEPDSLSIDGSAPLPVRRPAAVADLCDLVREAAGAGTGVYPSGGRTALDTGYPPAKPGVLVDMRGLDQVIDYPARDMTITVRAGITIAYLQQVLAREGQWLPVDVPLPDRATLGGAVALNQSGPRRFGNGTLRDYVIGISFVTDEGDEVKAGGRVVKNVAGYDLMKLHTGAVGTLGPITQLTLKVKPRPEAAVRVTFGCDAAALGAVLDVLHASDSRPAAVEVLNRAAAHAAGLGGAGGAAEWLIVLGFEEKAATVEWQVGTILAELKSAPVRDPADQLEPAAGVWQTLTDLQRRPESPAVWKANVRPSRVADLLAATADEPAALVHAEPLNGIVWVHSPAEPREAATAWLAARADAAGGNSAVVRCPAAWKAAAPVWGRPGGDADLMRQVKRSLDPQNVFNPGRLFRDA